MKYLIYLITLLSPLAISSCKDHKTDTELPSTSDSNETTSIAVKDRHKIILKKYGDKLIPILEIIDGIETITLGELEKSFSSYGKLIPVHGPAMRIELSELQLELYFWIDMKKSMELRSTGDIKETDDEQAVLSKTPICFITIKKLDVMDDHQDLVYPADKQSWSMEQTFKHFYSQE
jgi:hypothetical protein